MIAPKDTQALCALFLALNYCRLHLNGTQRSVPICIYYCIDLFFTTFIIIAFIIYLLHTWYFYTHILAPAQSLQTIGGETIQINYTANPKGSPPFLINGETLQCFWSSISAIVILFHFIFCCSNYLSSLLRHSASMEKHCWYAMVTILIFFK